ncbi:hypothetical protein PHYBOEH_002712 [Phytophthora boehmeriae]|uniref:Uncharacterized protein n=1 Tax=Phytophthora boehmeriae TaxID=109152 RepID=A0A8T1X750_9STRA|nr:hypothetical protein PHYBOEH_002712 [Phytophthora boehmeriae]
MATIYSGTAPASRFPFASHTHYTSNSDAATQIQMQLRYGASYGVENHLPSSPSGMGSPTLSTPPPGATLGLVDSKHHLYAESQGLRHSSPVYSNQNVSAAMYMQSMMSKMYQPQPPPMDMPQHSETHTVSPGLPTPLELSIYEVKQPTGFLHVTIGNQTVEFLDGVANMPQKR